MRIEEIRKLANKLNPLAVQQYLKNTGWKKEDSKRAEIAIYTKEQGSEFFEILLPQSRDFSDYIEQMIKSVKLIADYETREFEQVLSSLILSPSDVLKFRVINHDTEEGTIS